MLWAQYTVSFDSIIVFFDVRWIMCVHSVSFKKCVSHIDCVRLAQNAECVQGPLFQDFLRILAQIRSEHRLPLQVVLLTPPGQSRHLRLDSSAQGTEGILVRDFSLPPSKLIYGKPKQHNFILEL